jgi:hypothetical protein
MPFSHPSFKAVYIVFGVVGVLVAFFVFLSMRQDADVLINALVGMGHVGNMSCVQVGQGFQGGGLRQDV